MVDQTTSSPARAAGSGVVARVLLSFILGALVGEYESGIPVVYVLIASLVLLLVPMTLSAVLDRDIEAKGWAVSVILIVEVLVLGFAGAIAWLAAYPRTEVTVVNGISATYLGLLGVAVAFIAAFSFGSKGSSSNKTMGLAIGCAIAAWIGFGIRNFTGGVVTGAFSPTNGNDFASLELALAATGYIIGFGWAALGGVIGSALRTWLVRSTAQ